MAKKTRQEKYEEKKKAQGAAELKQKAARQLKGKVTDEPEEKDYEPGHETWTEGRFIKRSKRGIR